MPWASAANVNAQPSLAGSLLWGRWQFMQRSPAGSVLPGQGFVLWVASCGPPAMESFLLWHSVQSEPLVAGRNMDFVLVLSRCGLWHVAQDTEPVAERWARWSNNGSAVAEGWDVGRVVEEDLGCAAAVGWLN